MSKEIHIRIYDTFSDRGSRSRNLLKTICVDAATVVAGNPLPWTSPDEAPMVDYYDGESIEVSFGDRHINLRVGDPEAEIAEFAGPDNIYVRNYRTFCIWLRAMAVVECSATWSDMFEHESYNALVHSLLPHIANDHDAAAHFIRIFDTRQYIFHLSKATIGLIAQQAYKGCTLAQFALGRYYQCVQPCHDANAKAKALIEQAYRGGLADAAAALFLMWSNGDAGTIDTDKARKYLDEALVQGSYYACSLRIRSEIFGLNYMEIDYQAAQRHIEEVSKREAAEGLDPNPKWDLYRAYIAEKTQGISAATHLYEVAAKKGMLDAWGNLAIIHGFKGKEELADEEAYIKYLDEGCKHHDNFCIYLRLLKKIDDWDSKPNYEKAWLRGSIIPQLEKAYSLGSACAAHTIGDIYNFGYYDINPYIDKAWQWYEKAAKLQHVGSLEAMFDLINNHYVEKTEAETDLIALDGARLGSKILLNYVIHAYYRDRLTEYAHEIEEYHIPYFESLFPDDDGRFDPYA